MALLMAYCGQESNWELGPWKGEFPKYALIIGKFVYCQHPINDPPRPNGFSDGFKPVRKTI